MNKREKHDLEIPYDWIFQRKISQTDQVPVVCIKGGLFLHAESVEPHPQTSLLFLEKGYFVIGVFEMVF